MKKFDIRIIESNLNREDFSPIERKEVVSSYIIDDEVTPITEELVKGVLEYKWVDAKRFFLEARDKEPFKKLQTIEDRLAEERKIVCNQAKVDIRSLFNSYASSLIDYCIWNKNADNNQKLYNNFKRIINDRLVKVLDLFDKRIDQVERGE